MDLVFFFLIIKLLFMMTNFVLLIFYFVLDRPDDPFCACTNFFCAYTFSIIPQGSGDLNLGEGKIGCGLV